MNNLIFLGVCLNRPLNPGSFLQPSTLQTHSKDIHFIYMVRMHGKTPNFNASHLTNTVAQRMKVTLQTC